MSRESTNNNPTITFVFDRKENNHNLIIEGASGREMIIAAHSLISNIEEKSGLPFDVCSAMAAMEEAEQDDE